MKRNCSFLFALAVLLTVAACRGGSQTDGGAGAADSLATSATPADSLLPDELLSDICCYMVNHDYDGGFATFVLDMGEGTLQIYYSDKQELVDKYVLRIDSFEETENKTTEYEYDVSGHLVVNAYDPQTEAYCGQFDGTFSQWQGFAEGGDEETSADSYSGRFTHADGSVEKFEFYSD